MNFAFFLRSNAVSCLRTWAYRLITAHGVPQPQATSPVIMPSAVRRVTPIIQPCLQVRRPLRVVRVIENGQPRTHVGRMVISGRMADVCAELDRLAAREAAESCGRSSASPISC